MLMLKLQSFLVGAIFNIQLLRLREKQVLLFIELVAS